MNIKHSKKSLIVFTSLMFVVSCAYVGTFKQTISHADTSSTRANQFYIVGTKIVDPDGKVFVPNGANVGSNPNNFDWAGAANGQSDAALSWGWNTVRLNVYCTTAESYSRVNASDGDKVLLADIARIIPEYTAKKIVVMLECQDANLNDNDAATFWTDVATTYKNNPYVWFNYANEPEWGDNDKWITEQKRWLALVRSIGAENIFVADVMNAGNDAGWSGAKKIYDPSMGPALISGQCNVLMSLHNYGGQANSPDDIMQPGAYQDYWKNVQAAGLAMVIGEFGMDYRLAFQTQSNGTVKVVSTDPASDAKTIGNDYYNHAANGVYASINYAKDYGIGSLVWHATFADNLILGSPAGGITLPSGAYSGKPNFYNLLNSNKTGVQPGFSFSQMGADIWAAGHNRPAIATFTGDYSASNCATVKNSTTTPSPPTPITPSPVVLQPVGSTAIVSDTTAAQAAQFGLKEHIADPVLKASISSSISSRPAPVTKIKAGPTTSNSLNASSPSSRAASNKGATLSESKNPSQKTSTVPAELFSVAGHVINARQVGYFGGSTLLVLLTSIFGFYFANISRNRRLYAQHHIPVTGPKSKGQLQAVAPRSHGDILTTPSQGLHEPGTIVRPNNLP